MVKKLLLSLLITFMAMSTNAQSIGMVGDFNSWGNDVVMDTSDNITYTKRYTFLISGQMKFRQDAAWTTNWGAPSTSNPSPLVGVGVPNGANNFNIPAGTYDITLNRTTGDYSFVEVITNFAHIGFYGGFNAWATPGVDMVTTDGVDYIKVEHQFTAADVKFLKDNDTAQTWGGTAFPAGTATAGGASIPLTAGFYNVAFNYTTLDYSFVQVPVSLIGNGVSDWDTDVYLVSTDGGINFTGTGIELFSGAVKFRSNNSWANNWGGTAFPTGTGTLGSSNNIPTTPGIYDVTFNRLTGDYTFTFTQATVDNVQINGTTMATSNGNTYTMNDFYVSTPGAAFINATTSTFYAGGAYPAGTAVAGSTTPIPVPVGYYNVTFDKTTLAYSFTVTPVAMIGSATSGGWTTETPMTTIDNGVNFTATGVTLTAGELKFRSNNTWTYAWGGTAFPAGTGDTASGAPNIPVVAGTYDVTFNRTTGDYTFTNLSASQFEKGKLAVYPNPANTYFTISADVTNVEIFNITGQLVKSFTTSQEYNIADLTSGLYVVKAKDANNRVSTAKLIVE